MKQLQYIQFIANCHNSQELEIIGYWARRDEDISSSNYQILSGYIKHKEQEIKIMSTDEYVNQINKAQDITSLQDVIIRANLDEDLSCEEAHILRTHSLRRKHELMEGELR